MIGEVFNEHVNVPVFIIFENAIVTFAPEEFIKIIFDAFYNRSDRISFERYSEVKK